MLKISSTIKSHYLYKMEYLIHMSFFESMCWRLHSCIISTNKIRIIILTWYIFCLHLNTTPNGSIQFRYLNHHCFCIKFHVSKTLYWIQMLTSKRIYKAHGNIWNIECTHISTTGKPLRTIYAQSSKVKQKRVSNILHKLNWPFSRKFSVSDLVYSMHRHYYFE